jgi:hypothetical protein
VVLQDHKGRLGHKGQLVEQLAKLAHKVPQVLKAVLEKQGQ